MKQGNDPKRGVKQVPENAGSDEASSEGHGLDQNALPDDPQKEGEDPYDERRATRAMNPGERYGGQGDERPFPAPDSRYYADGMHTGPDATEPKKSKP